MTGAWTYVDYDNVFFSKVRSMARFGLLIQNNCIWNTDTLLYDTAYINQMTQTSQNINLSYGYLWWLNGKSSFMLPTSQMVFTGSWAPDAPGDMFAGLGKNGQILSISKSMGLVLVRMGLQAGTGEVPTQLCNSIWEKLNAVMCNSSSVSKTKLNRSALLVFPNPAHNQLHISTLEPASFKILILDVLGNERYHINMENQTQINLDIADLPTGLYVIKASYPDRIQTLKFVKD